MVIVLYNSSPLYRDSHTDLICATRDVIFLLSLCKITLFGNGPFSSAVAEWTVMQNDSWLTAPLLFYYILTHNSSIVNLVSAFFGKNFYGFNKLYWNFPNIALS